MSRLNYSEISSWAKWMEKESKLLILSFTLAGKIMKPSSNFKILMEPSKIIPLLDRQVTFSIGIIVRL